MLALVAGLLLLARPASAQPGGEDLASVRHVQREKAVKPGGIAVVAIEMTLKPGYHSWPEKGVELPKSVDELADRTTLNLDVAKSPYVRLVAVQWPDTKPGKVGDPDKGGKVTVPLYSGRSILYATLAIAPDAPPGELTPVLMLHYQACDETTCFFPEEPELPLAINVDPSSSAATNSERDDLFGGYKPVDPTLIAAIEWPRTEPPAAASNSGTNGPNATGAPAAPVIGPSLLGFQFGDGLILLFLFAAIGGFVLNLTPCVLPVIPIKVMTLVQHAGHPGRRISLGFWMALGVVFFWAAVGTPVWVLHNSISISNVIFGTWWVTLGIGLLIALMGLGIMGLFLFQLPQSVYAINPKADTPWGSFLFGVMTAVLGLPCFGFVAGGLLAGASALPRSSIAAVFLGLGVGMAIPYLLLSIWPTLVNRVPRTGPASELVKQVMGLLLIAAASYFIASGIDGLLAEMPYLRSSLPFWIVSFFVLLAALWLVIRTLRIARSAAIRVVVPTMALLAAGATIGFAAISAKSDREDWIRVQGASAGSAGIDDGEFVTGAWIPYTEARLNKALAAGKVVVCDFTAIWCVNCKVLKRTVLDRDPVRSRLQQDDVVLLEVDCGVKTSPGSAFLNRIKESGVPVLAFYGPAIDRANPLKYNAYLPETVLAAVEAAKGVSRVTMADTPGLPLSPEPTPSPASH